ncbi:MAG: sugar kinase, partial [Jatrophihabitans sp.]
MSTDEGTAARRRAAQPATVGQVFELVRTGTAATRSDIARLTGLSRTAVPARLASRLEAGLGRDTDEAPSRVGRPAARLEF